MGEENLWGSSVNFLRINKKAVQIRSVLPWVKGKKSDDVAL